MRKNSFIEGTIVATVGIFLVKIIGILYVSPFYAIIGEHGGALYGYGYTIYQLFLSISSAGFPFAISKLTSEYSALGYKKAVNDTYLIALKLISVISVIIFLILFIFAPQIGHYILGAKALSSDYLEVAFVIRCVSFAILVVPFLSVTRGFLQGHKYIEPYSISQVIEQIVRVFIILVGSFICVRILHLPVKYAVGVSVSAAFFGGLFSYFYLKRKIKRANLLTKGVKKDDVDISFRDIVRKIFIYSCPFILISLVNNLYTTVDMVLINHTMKDLLHFPLASIDSISGTYTTWGTKLNNIILAVSTGLVTSLIPNIVSDFTKNNVKGLNEKINKAFQCVLLVIVPMTIFMSLLSKSIWTLFYGDSIFGPVVYQYFVYTALFGGIYTIVINMLQGINKYKLVIVTVLIGLFTNAILDVPLMLLFHSLSFNVSYGAITAALIGYSLSIFISLFVLYKKYHFSFKSTFSRIFTYFLSWGAFVLVILILKLVVPVSLNSRFLQIPFLILYGVCSGGIYLFLSDYFDNIYSVFGFRIRDVISKKLKK